MSCVSIISFLLLFYFRHIFCVPSNNISIVYFLLSVLFRSLWKFIIVRDDFYKCVDRLEIFVWLINTCRIILVLPFLLLNAPLFERYSLFSNRFDFLFEIRFCSSYLYLFFFIIVIITVTIITIVIIIIIIIITFLSIIHSASISCFCFYFHFTTLFVSGLL